MSILTGPFYAPEWNYDECGKYPCRDCGGVDTVQYWDDDSSHFWVCNKCRSFVECRLTTVKGKLDDDTFECCQAWWEEYGVTDEVE